MLQSADEAAVIISLSTNKVSLRPFEASSASITINLHRFVKLRLPRFVKRSYVNSNLRNQTAQLN
ncbi:MAG: hypothetical protein ACTS47_00855 [Candidatus Hodgkinia cicadicola]